MRRLNDPAVTVIVPTPRRDGLRDGIATFDHVS